MSQDPSRRRPARSGLPSIVFFDQNRCRLTLVAGLFTGVEGSFVAATEGLADVDAAESAVAAKLEEVVADTVAVDY